MKLLAGIYHLLLKHHLKEKRRDYLKKFDIDPTVRLPYLENTWLYGNIHIGKNTYFNGGRIVTGPNSKVVIGEWCAIGHNVNIIAWTHDTEESTGPMSERPTIEKDISIGNHVWIGTNAFIREGVTVGDNSIIGANSMVINDVEANSIVGGVPARLIKYKNEST
jgi:maltose O-acetyltransferase